MLASHRSTAPVTLTTTADATNLVNLRNQFKAAVPGAADVPSYTDFLVKLTASALVKHPLLNSRWEGEQIVTPPGIHIGVAVDTDAGLLVPVVRDVPALGLRQLSARSRDLAARARAGTLTADELRGGTFTLTNLGAFGIDTFTPLINYPQCAILGAGRIERRPIVVAEQVVVRDQLALSLTFDHRIVDGAPAARFLQTLRTILENPGPWLMS
jgi:pyruvate dehydrogenase E2 component (dihydrolipoamide acetyltransferase)